MLKGYDVVYLDHNELFKDKQVAVNDKFVIPYYPYWNSAYAINPNTALKLINSAFKDNIIPVDELFPLCFNVDYHNYCLNDTYIVKSNFIELKKKLSNISLSPIAYTKKIFCQKSRSVLGSDIESGIQMNKHALVITVGTDKDKLKHLLKSTEKFNINILNLGQDVVWNGGTMDGPGGGQKLNLVKQYLNKSSLRDDDIVLFVDGYDVIFNDDLETIVSRYKEFNTDILFAAEKECWPVPSMANLFPKSETEYRFLNSGCYIGTKKAITVLLSDTIQDGEDDQLYLQKRFLSTSPTKIKLDHENYIFQCISKSFDEIKIRDNGQLINNSTRACPCILHGNGGQQDKINFNKLASALLYKREELISPFYIPKTTQLQVAAPEMLIGDFFTKEQCQAIIKLADEKGDWEPMPGDKFPAQEIRVMDLDFNLFVTIESYLKERIYPAIEKYWSPTLMYGIRDMFVMRYSLDTQTTLGCHNDASLITGSIKLNEDYEGAELIFPRQNFSNINVPVGNIILFPGQVTHGHLVNELKSGVKYSLTIWTSRYKGDLN